VALREYADLKRRLAAEYGDDGTRILGCQETIHRIDSEVCGRERAGYGFGPFLDGRSVWRFIV
jgi:hypothetical protein